MYHYIVIKIVFSQRVIVTNTSLWCTSSIWDESGYYAKIDNMGPTYFPKQMNTDKILTPRHCGCGFYNECLTNVIKCNPMLTLINLMTRSNVLLIVFKKGFLITVVTKIKMLS